MNIEKIIQKSDYDFLRNEDSLQNILFLTYGGSHAYGTNIEGSDIDIRGVVLNSLNDLIGFGNFEQRVDVNTDTTIYGFNKFISLLLNCNPNVIELLGCKKEHYYQVSEIGQQLLDNKKLFLSQKAIGSFKGYATQQLRRLQNALARDHYSHNEKEQHMLGSIHSAMRDFENRYKEMPEGSVVPYIDFSDKLDFEKEIFIDVNLKKYPLRDYKGMWSDMSNVVKNYSSLNHRNNKKDDAHLNKHAMHLIRLYLMCLDILEKEEINTYRENDIDLLMSIRKGEYQNQDKSFKSEFFEMVDSYENRLDYAVKNTSLKYKPSYKEIEEFVIEVNKKVITNEL